MYRLTAALTFSLAGFAHADVPRVVTDIAPVHALVSQVMDGIGAPDLMIPAGATPHSYAMRPSEARALANADVIIWVGPVLTPWLEDGLETLSGDAMQLVLAEAEGTVHLQNRKGGRCVEHGVIDFDPLLKAGAINVGQRCPCQDPCQHQTLQKGATKVNAIRVCVYL